jgi:hypothetical protein
MVRSVILIAAAIQLSQPGMSAKQAKSYATVVQQEAKKRHFDPFSLVAIIHFESWWSASAVSPGGRDLGLAQIRYQYSRACRNDKDPVNKPSKKCAAFKASLLNPIFNIRYASAHITRSREFCRKKVGRATYHGWLAAWQGSHKRGKWCRKNKHTTLRVKYRGKLVKLANQGRLKLKNKAKPKPKKKRVAKRRRRR